LIDLCKKKNIPIMIYYRLPLHMQGVFKKLGYSKGILHVSESISKKIFSIPMHPYLGINQQDAIIETLINFEKS